MTIQEKCDQVIQGLVVCVPGSCGKEKCPYYEGPESEYWGSPDGYRCEYDLRQDAIKLLKALKEVRDNLPGEIHALHEIELALDKVIGKTEVSTAPRVLELAELDRLETIWLEIKAHNKVEAALYHGVNSRSWVHYLVTSHQRGMYALPECRYGIDWRCWDMKPTDEQRRATAWK